MQHYRSLEDCHLDASWVTIGSFDGVHLGHQTIIRQMVEEAKSNASSTVVITFFPRPAAVLHHSAEQSLYLTKPEDRAHLLGNLGIDYIFTLPFDQSFASLSAQEFMEKLSQQFGVKQLWVGYDFAMGKHRQGNPQALDELGKTLGFQINIIQPVKIGSRIVSSSCIRQLISNGNVKQAAALLGRWYALNGNIIHGDMRGRTLGFPTANLDVWDLNQLPARGVYATWAVIGEKKYPSITNIGFRPTFKNNSYLPKIETYIIDFNEDLYNKSLTIEFVEYFRAEQKFSSADLLKQQLNQDVLRAQKFLEAKMVTPV